MNVCRTTEAPHSRLYNRTPQLQNHALINFGHGCFETAALPSLAQNPSLVDLHHSAQAPSPSLLTGVTRTHIGFFS